VRNTDFGHLRDGFTRTLLARAKEQRKAGVLNGEEDDIKVDTGIQVLKSVFPAGSVPKGSPLTLVAHDGNLFVEYGGRVIGAVHDKWIADNMIKAYFSTQPISPAVSCLGSGVLTCSSATVPRRDSRGTTMSRSEASVKGNEGSKIKIIVKHTSLYALVNKLRAADQC